MPLWHLDRLLVWPSWARLGDRGVHACVCTRAVDTTLQWDMTCYSLCFTTSISAKPGMASASLPKRANVGRLLLMVVVLHSCRGDREGKCFTVEDTVQRQKCTQTSKLLQWCKIFQNRIFSKDGSSSPLRINHRKTLNTMLSLQNVFKWIQRNACLLFLFLFLPSTSYMSRWTRLISHNFCYFPFFCIPWDNHNLRNEENKCPWHRLGKLLVKLKQ